MSVCASAAVYSLQHVDLLDCAEIAQQRQELSDEEDEDDEGEIEVRARSFLHPLFRFDTDVCGWLL